MISRRTVIVSLAVGGTLALTGCMTPVDQPVTSRLIALRHADRDLGAENLNATGRARAEALPSALSDVHIDAIYAPDTQRNLDTAAPLARARGLTVEIIDRAVIGLEKLAETIHTTNPGETAVWVGNTGNLKSLWAELGLPEEDAPLDYGEISIVSFSGDKVIRVEERTFAP